jgi:hypothetical protein
MLKMTRGKVAWFQIQEGKGRKYSLCKYVHTSFEAQSFSYVRVTGSFLLYIKAVHVEVILLHQV